MPSTPRRPSRLASRWNAIRKWLAEPAEKSWSRKKRILIWTTLATALATSAGISYFRSHPREWRVTQRILGVVKTPPVTIHTKDGKPFTYNKAPVPSEFVGSGDMCLRYARLVAKDHGYQYNRADAAWTFHDSNKTAWKKGDKSNYQEQLKPFRIIGVYNPQSENNKPGREFTHVLLYLGHVNGKEIVAHNLHGSYRMDPLDFVLNDLLSDGHHPGEVRRIFAPRNE